MEISSVRTAEGNFNAGKSVAESLKNNIRGNIISGKQKSSIPQFKEGFSISETETSHTMDHAGKNEASQAVFEIHKNRGIYKFDENDPLFERSEGIEKEPEKALNEVEEVESGEEGYTIEYCEECSDEEYLVKARKIKRRYVYLDKPPYITATAYCENHGRLSVKVEIPEEPNEIFREDGQFENIQFLGKAQEGAVLNERYRVNGFEIILRKTIMQNGRPWIHPKCYLVPHLQNQVLDAKYLIRELLGGSKDKDLNWGKLGKGHLYHRVVNDTGEHYWDEDDKCKEYERLCDAGLCRYVSMVEDPETDKYWKGKKVRGSWGQTLTYACKYDDGTSNCKKLRLRGCEQIGSECIKEIAGRCVKWRQKYRCRDRIRSKGYRFSGETAFCLDGDCVDTSFKSDEDLIEALERANKFSSIWMENVYRNPELNYSLISPTSQKARHVYLHEKEKKKMEKIGELSKEYGLFYFFKKGCEYCKEFGPIVKRFSEKYKWSVLAISEFGEEEELFDRNVRDNGLAERWGVSTYPSLFAVNPNTGDVIPIANGMISIEEMEERIMLITRENEENNANDI